MNIKKGNTSFKKYKRPLKFVWNSFKWHQKMFFIFLLWKLIEWIFYVLFPIFAKLEMDQLVEKNRQLFWIIELTSFNIFLIILFIIFWFKLVENLLKWFISIFENDYTKFYENIYSSSLYKKLESLDPWLFLNARNKKFIWEVIGNSNNIWYSIRELFWNSITNIFGSFCSTVSKTYFSSELQADKKPFHIVIFIFVSISHSF